jgi:hypothetical protein
MNPDDLPFDQVSLLPEDWDELEDGEIDLGAVKLADLDDSAERV